MTISQGDKLPEGTLIRFGANGPEQITIEALTKGRKVAIFAVPGAFTPTCSVAHLPSFIRTKAQFDAKGVDEVVCISVNDIFVMKAWGETSGATEAGVSMLADPGAYTKALGLAFDAPGAGLFSRSKRYAMYVVDGVVEVLHLEENSGVCDVSGGEALLAAI